LSLPVRKSLDAFRVEAASPTKPAGGRSGAKAAGRAAPEADASAQDSPADLLAGLAGWMEPRHTLLLRTLLDRTGAPRASGASAVMRGTHRILDDLRLETRLKFAEFREKWEARLVARALVPFLARNQWIEERPEGGVGLAGKGGRKEARMLYLQTGHDMATDCARQWASLAGRLQVFQASFAAEWHAAAVEADDDATRLLPVLEASLRDAELEAWKSLRLSLGDLAEEAFVRAASKWELRSFPDAEALVRGTLHPWAARGLGGNGYSGFMQALSALAERLSLAMLDHYERKWDLFLRGLPEIQTEAQAVEAVG
jgi:hypothetical protein